jgi:chromosome segregation ATPase
MTSPEYQQLVEFLGQQFTEVDRRFDEVNRRFTEVGGRFTEVDRRFDELAGQLAELRRDMLGHFDEVYRRLERLEQEYHAITQGLRRIEAGLADERGRREILERDLAGLKQQAAALQARIEDIEQRLRR